MDLLIYYFLYGFLCVVAFYSMTVEGKKSRDVLLLYVTFLLIVFAGFRDKSPDQISYQRFFEHVSTLSEVISGDHNYSENYVEWGYKFILSAIKSVTKNETIMFIAIAVLVVGSIAFACSKISPYPLVSILCYYSWFYYSNMGALRHALASSIILLMIVALAANKRLLSVPIYFAAVSVHSASAVAGVLWFLKVIVRWRIAIILLLFSAFVFAFLGGIGRLVINSIFPYCSITLQNKFLFYMNSEYGIQETISRGVVFKQLAVSTVSLIYINELKNRFDSFELVFGAYIFSFCVLLFFQDMKILNNRLANALAISEIILIPMILSLFNTRERVVAFITLSLLLFYQVYRLVGVQFYPYKFILI